MDATGDAAPPVELRDLLEACPEPETREKLLASLRPGLRLELQRVTERRLRPGLLGRLFSQSAVAPSLALLTSRYGGLPYLESADDWPRTPAGAQYGFVAQLYLDEFACDEAQLPRRGIFVLFENTACAGMDDRFAWRWYPEPADERAVAVEGPSLARWECRVLGTVTRSCAVELLHSPAYRASVEREGDAGPCALFDAKLSAWLDEHGANAGAWLHGALSGPGPRLWAGAPPAEGERWLQLWAPLSETAGITPGSMAYSVMIRADDLAAAKLDRCAMLCWQ